MYSTWVILIVSSSMLVCMCDPLNVLAIIT